MPSLLCHNYKLCVPDHYAMGVRARTRPATHEEHWLRPFYGFTFFFFFFLFFLFNSTTSCLLSLPI